MCSTAVLQPRPQKTKVETWRQLGRFPLESLIKSTLLLISNFKSCVYKEGKGGGKK